MTVIAFRSPVTKPLVRHDVAVVSGDRSQFRVTQRFADPDFYWRDIDPARAALGHRATDIGDYGCGSPLVSMAAGVVTHHVDNATAYGAPNNAICSRLNVGPGTGLVIDYWHCAGHLVGNGALVLPGTPVAIVGNTGLGQVCHCHITFTLNGQLMDPEPHMFGAPLDLSAPSEEPMYNPKDLLALYGQQIVTKAGARMREKQGTSYPILTDFPAGVQLTATARVVGEPVSGSIEWFETKAELNGQVRTGFVHSSAVDVVPPPPPPPPSGFTQKQVDDARDEGTSIGFSRAKTKASAAVGAIEP